MSSLASQNLLSCLHAEKYQTETCFFVFVQLRCNQLISVCVQDKRDGEMQMSRTATTGLYC